MSTEQPTAVEIHEALNALQAEIGVKSYVSLSVYYENSRKGMPVSVSIYPEGICGKRAIYLDAADFSSALRMMKDKWAEASVGHDRQMVRDMALEIIRITADMGACSDAALRAGKFSSADVIKYGERACVEANEIASNGPFKITLIAAISNAA